jgi:hypothetical protein
MEQWRRRYREKIFVLVSQYGPLPAKAFPGRAAILVKLLGLSEEHIVAVIFVTKSLAHKKNRSRGICHLSVKEVTPTTYAFIERNPRRLIALGMQIL